MRVSLTLLTLILIATAWTLAAQERTVPPMPSLDPPGALKDTPLSPIKGPISGQLRFPKGAEAPQRILVRLESPTGSIIAETWTDKSGRFEIRDIACGFYALAINAASYRPVRISIEQSYTPFDTTIQMIPAEGSAQEAAYAPSGESPVPEKAGKEFIKGRAASAANKADEGIKHFRKAIELYPDYDEAYVELGMALLTRGSFPDAESVAKAALARNEKNALAHAILGSAYREQNKLPESLRALEQSLKSLKLKENSWFVHLELGRTLLKMKRTEEAYP
ncbi:MAG: tetratricopeptide repeat protein, partial [Candidatus Acidiferrales bacterium]